MNPSLKIIRRPRHLAALLVPFAMLVGAVAFASPPHVFHDNDPLLAADLNLDFDDLDRRVGVIETAPLLSESATAEHGTPSADLVYQSVFVDLPPGTWRVEGATSLSSTGTADQVQVALWNDTTSSEIAHSRSPYAQIVAIGGTAADQSCNGTTSICTTASLTTTAVVVVAAATRVKLKALRNGASTVWVGSPVSLALPRVSRILATRLK